MFLALVVSFLLPPAALEEQLHHTYRQEKRVHGRPGGSHERISQAPADGFPQISDLIGHHEPLFLARLRFSAGEGDPLVMAWGKGIAARGELRHQFCHASDLAPTLLEVVGVKPPKMINGIKQMPIEGTSFARSLSKAKAPSKKRPQYFEMFGHRGLVQDGWKAVSFHPPGNAFDPK